MRCKHKKIEKKLDKLIKSDEEVHEMLDKHKQKMKKATIWGFATK